MLQAKFTSIIPNIMIPDTMTKKSVVTGSVIGFLMFFLSITYIGMSKPFISNNYDNIKVWIGPDQNMHLWFKANKKRDCRLSTTVLVWRPILRFGIPTRQQMKIDSFVTALSTTEDTEPTEHVVTMPRGVDSNWNYQTITSTDCDWFAALLPSPVYKSPSYSLSSVPPSPEYSVPAIVNR